MLGFTAPDLVPMSCTFSQQAHLLSLYYGLMTE